MKNLDCFNYWTDRIVFKEKIEDDLKPILKSYIGKELSNKTLEEIRSEVISWISSINEVTFDCDIKVDIENKDGKDIVKVINVVPIDV